MTGHPDPLEIILECLEDYIDIHNPQDCGPAKYQRNALMVVAKRIQCRVTSFSPGLMYEAAGTGMLNLTAVLFRCGADSNLQHDGKTPLHGVIRKLNRIAHGFFYVDGRHIPSEYVEPFLAVAMLLLENGGNWSTVSCRSRILYPLL